MRSHKCPWVLGINSGWVHLMVVSSWWLPIVSLCLVEHPVDLLWHPWRQFCSYFEKVITIVYAPDIHWIHALVCPSFLWRCLLHILCCLWTIPVCCPLLVCVVILLLWLWTWVVLLSNPSSFNIECKVWVPFVWDFNGIEACRKVEYQHICVPSEALLFCMYVAVLYCWYLYDFVKLSEVLCNPSFEQSFWAFIWFFQWLLWCQWWVELWCYACSSTLFIECAL